MIRSISNIAISSTLVVMSMITSPAFAEEGLGGKFGFGLGLGLQNSSTGVGAIYHVTDNIGVRATLYASGDLTGFAAWGLYYIPASSSLNIYGGAGFASFKGPEISGPGYSASTSGSGAGLTGGVQYDLSRSAVKNLHIFAEADYWAFKVKGEAKAESYSYYGSYSASAEYEADVSDIDIVLGIIYYF